MQALAAAGRLLCLNERYHAHRYIVAMPMVYPWEGIAPSTWSSIIKVILIRSYSEYPDILLFFATVCSERVGPCSFEAATVREHGVLSRPCY